MKSNGVTKSTKLIEIQTEHVIPFKTLIEVLKDILDDVTIEIKRDKKMNEKETKEDTDSDEETVNTVNEKEDKKSKKGKVDKNLKNKKGKDVKKNKKSSDDSDEEDDAKSDDESGDEDTASNKKDKEKENDDNKGGIKILTVDKLKTLLVHVKLPADRFDVFKCKHKTCDIGVNLIELQKLVKSLDKDDTLKIYIDEEDEQNLVLNTVNREKSSDTIDTLKLMDVDKNHYKIPPTAFDASIRMDSSEFHKLCNEMANLSEDLEIKCTAGAITFTCQGDGSGRTKTYYVKDNGIQINFSNKAKVQIVQGIFELKYLNMFKKCANLCNQIQIFMKNNYPLCINYTVATLGTLLIGLTPVNEKNTNNFDDDEDLYEDEGDKIVMKKDK
jgi:proliferating cell nuclear antigen